MNALPFSIHAQPDGRSCGPTCLHAIYDFWGLQMPLDELVGSIDQLDGGGTLAVQLGTHALSLGFEATIYTYNLQLFDPTWFHPPVPSLAAKLRAQLEQKGAYARLIDATPRYLAFLEGGGRVEHVPLSPGMLAGFLDEGVPVLTGLSSTYLYDAAREVPESDESDDLRGEPTGHFVVICGMDLVADEVAVANPWPGPSGEAGTAVHSTWRVLTAIALGTLTYDANLLVLRRGSR